MNYEGRQDLTCFYCGIPSSVTGLDRHHVIRRSAAPERIEDETNIMFLCRQHHDRATNDKKFEILLQKLWNQKQNNLSP